VGSRHSCGDSNDTKSGIYDMVAEFGRQYSDLAAVEVIDLDAEERIDEGITALNDALSASGDRWRISRSNLPWVMSQSAPVIIIDGKVASTGQVPTADELANALRNGLAYIPVGW